MTKKINIMPFQRFHTNNYGEINHDEAIAEQLVSNFKKDVTGYPIPLLISHSEAQGKLADITELEKQQDGLYATIETNAKGEKILDKTHFDFVSPAYAGKYKNKKTGEEVGHTLLEVSLTNRPGQPNMAKLSFSDESADEIKIQTHRRTNNMDEATKKLFTDQINAKDEKIIALTDEIKTIQSTHAEEIKKLTDDVATKDSTIKELTDKITEVEKAKFDSEVEAWAKNWTDAKGRKPAMVDKFKEQVKAGTVTMEFADGILEETENITETSGKVVKFKDEKIDEVADVIAKTLKGAK